MMLVPIELEPYSGHWSNLTEEEYAAIRAAHFPTWPEEKPKYGAVPTFWGDANDMQVLAKYNLAFKVDLEALRSHTGTQITRLVDKLDALYGSSTNPPSVEVVASDGRAHEGLAQIHVPDFGLLGILHVTWLEDACTEQLQDHLDQGWRILAVCPPNAQRRPDYILGRKDAP